MKIRVEVDHPDVVAILSSMEPQDYYVMSIYQKDGISIGLISVYSQEWRNWFEQKHPGWILK